MTRPHSLAAAVLVLVLAAGFASPAVGNAGAVIVHTVPVEALRSNLLGDPAEIRVAVYLPPAYDSSPARRYRSIYLLHGWLGSIDEFGVREGKPGFQGMQLAATMDEAIARGIIAEVIVVVPEGRNRYFGSFYLSSSVTGRWEDAIARELVPWIDARYRTEPGADSRGIAGFSMGGFGAIVLAMKHPDVFGAVYALSPCCLGMVEDIGPGNPWWENAGRLRGIALDVGAQDEFAQIPAGTRLLSQELARFGIAHSFEIYAGGTHRGMIRERIETRVPPFFSRTLLSARKLPASP